MNWGKLARIGLNVLTLGIPVAMRWLRQGDPPSAEEVIELATDLFAVAVDECETAEEVAEAIVAVEHRARILASASGWLWGEREERLVRSVVDRLERHWIAEKMSANFRKLAEAGDAIVERIKQG